MSAWVRSPNEKNEQTRQLDRFGQSLDKARDYSQSDGSACGQPMVN
jgi:hypothetical protein